MISSTKSRLILFLLLSFYSPLAASADLVLGEKNSEEINHDDSFILFSDVDLQDNSSRNSLHNKNDSQKDQPFWEGDGALSDQVLRIPEPMFFDLIRPLGAKKGELEVNALADYNLRTHSAGWAPEIEYAFADGFAIELELPAEDLKINDFKLALQGTFGFVLDKNMIHGWQLIGLKNRASGRYSGDALYINGTKLSDKLTTLNMIGIRRTELSGDGETKVLLNNNIFYDFSKRITVGLEINNTINAKGAWRSLILPQLHLDTSAHNTLQIGLGIANQNETKQSEKVLAIRLIHAF